MSTQLSSVLAPVSDPAQESKPIWKECYPISDPTQLPDPSSLPNTAEAESDSESDAEAETESPETKSFSTLVAVATGKELAQLLFDAFFRKSVDAVGQGKSGGTEKPLKAPKAAAAAPAAAPAKKAPASALAASNMFFGGGSSHAPASTKGKDAAKQEVANQAAAKKTKQPDYVSADLTKDDADEQDEQVSNNNPKTRHI
jgi:hypothetical protein